MTIYFLHGVVDAWSAGVESHRNYVDIAAFEHHLQALPHRYVRWDSGRETGDVLTVDDATCAGAEACRLARRNGHEVIFFINPLQIATGLPYFFGVLDAAIDSRTVSQAIYRGVTYPLATPHQRTIFRRAVKASVIARSAEDALQEVEHVADLLGSAGLVVPAHAQLVSLDTLRALRDIGVQVENHGWSHVDIAGMNEAAFREHVSKGAAWIKECLGVESNLYAVPFGLTDVEPDFRPLVGDAYFLADYRQAPRRLGAVGWNREDLTERLQQRQ